MGTHEYRTHLYTDLGKLLYTCFEDLNDCDMVLRYI